jgi:hypothetical protein
MSRPVLRVTIAALVLFTLLRNLPFAFSSGLRGG